ncbi:F390 synthetase-related protein [Ramlibacter sp. WS9]|uniref:F390 synthetase-related protein n=1 Tax=Ramlibacter sp. WS9 TaxID=1882741 RepID=UPI0011438BE4|nr:F390 synthetase-related protein [Ramlibacter sp. WS9]ROZ74326.1 CoF synthetase [Ramlibacter sp. WS9]
MPTAITDLLSAAGAFAKTRWLAKRLRTRADVERYQAARIRDMLRDTVSPSAFYRDKSAKLLEELPAMDKRTLLANFPQLNAGGLTVEQVQATLSAGGDRIGNYVVGQSTGTSGNRGYYVISNRERFVWLGTLLAKALPDALWRRHRVALALPGLSSLYQSAASGSRIQLGFFDLARGVDAWAHALVAFAPDTIVAQPKVLRHLAERGMLQAQTLFSGAEVLDPLDRRIIEEATGRRVREIYMATEGLFGVACPHGTLHLAEDVVHFGWEKPSAQSPLLSPLVTDFTRKVQVMARYRMNDLLELSHTPCLCGSPFQAVARIDGRQDDIFLLATADGGQRMATPDVLRNAVVDADRRILDFRIVQTGPAQVRVSLDAALSPEVDGAVVASIQRLCDGLGVAGVNVAVVRGITADTGVKLRRVRREWSPPPS